MTPESLAHEQWESLAVGRALDALEPADEAALAGHLPLCAHCRRLIEEMRDVAAELAMAADPVPLPPALWAGISSAVEASDRPPLPVQASPAKRRPTANPDARSGSAVTELGQQRRRTRTGAGSPAWLRWGAALSAAALVIVAVVVGGMLYSDKVASQRQLAVISRCVSTSDCSVTTLRGPTANAIALIQGARVRLVVEHVPSNDPKTSTYVLWQTSPQGATAVGTFDVTGSGLRVIPVRGLKARVRTGGLAITREPGRRAPEQPSVDPLMQGTLT